MAHNSIGATYKEIENPIVDCLSLMQPAHEEHYFPQRRLEFGIRFYRIPFLHIDDRL